METKIIVTPEAYIRAETDRQFGQVVEMAGGVNRLFHFRSPTPLDKQNVVRMNRDTLYSMGVVDTYKGATITVPELPKDRYASVYLVDNDPLLSVRHLYLWHTRTAQGYQIPGSRRAHPGVQSQRRERRRPSQQVAGSVHHQGQWC